MTSAEIAKELTVALIAKITPPKTSGVFPRKRLFRLLDECRKSPVVWVSAPAGSGKTTLVASYLSDRKLQSIWYRVDEGDGDIAASREVQLPRSNFAGRSEQGRRRGRHHNLLLVLQDADADDRGLFRGDDGWRASRRRQERNQQ